MNKTFLSTGLVLALTLGAQATLVTWYSGTLNSTLADNSAAGATYNTTGGTWSGAPSGAISSVNVELDFSGGYNGDLYGYLVYNDGNNTQTAFLLNRVGGGSGTTVAATSGFGGGATTDFASLVAAGVTLSDSGTSGSIQNTVAAAGNSYTAVSSLNGTFGGMSSGGTWTLFLADLATGDQTTLVSWGLSIDIVPVPEPATWAMIVFGFGITVVSVARRARRGIVGTIAH